MNVLFLTHRLPHAPNRGDRMRAYYLLEEMARFATVSLFSLVHDDEEAAAVARMPFAQAVRAARVTPWRNRVRGLLRWHTSRPLTFSLLDAPGVRSQIDELVSRHPPDVVVAYCSSMARFAFDAPLAGRPLVLDMVDVDSAKWRDLSLTSGAPLRWVYAREAATLAAFESLAAGRAVTTLVVTERERAELRALAPAADIQVIANGIDLGSYAPSGPPADSPQAVFSGVMNYRPNVDAVEWFATRVWPRVTSQLAGARFVVVGASPVQAVRALAARDRTIDVTGTVPTIQPHLWRSAVCVAPLQMARGVQNKVLEGLAAGLPAVVTSVVYDGLPVEARPGCIVADTPDAFADAVLDLLRQSPSARRHRASAATLKDLGWATQLRPLEAVLTRASASGRRP